MQYIGGECLDLRLTLIDSAQSFLWKEAGGRFGAVLRGEPVWLEQRQDGIYAEGGEVDFLRNYLDLNRDYGCVAAEYGHIPVAKRCIELYPGLRILNQEPWPTLVTFIISANNNVARIKKLCDSLAENFGERHGELYELPSPERLAACSEAELRKLGFGYRAPYLIETAARVAEGFPLNDLQNMDYETAHEQLIQLKGVGDKVADCVLLFSCRQASAFPVDTWVAKLLKSWFGIEAKGRKKLLTQSRNLLGEHAGLLQQFLFHAARTGGIELETQTETKEG